MKYRCHADIGGREGFGRVAGEEDEPFAAAWEPQTFALMLATGSTGSWNVDTARSVLETLPDYSSLSYYEKWLEGLEKLSIECGLLHPDEIAAARMLFPPRPVTSVLRADEVAAVLAAGASTLRHVTSEARFAVGDRVRTRAAAVDHHTRLPGYTRGKMGRIEQVHGPHAFPDTNSQGLGEQPQWLYAVVFSGQELWGPQTDPGLTVSIDAWEPYLEDFG